MPKTKPTEFTFNISHIKDKYQDLYRDLFTSLKSIIDPDQQGDLEFHIGLAVFELTDIFFLGQDPDPVDLVNFYHKCTTEAIIEMVLIPQEQAKEAQSR